MSGIAALVNLDGQPVEPRRLAGMSDALSHRGPDGAGLWHHGHVGLVHRALRTTEESCGADFTKTSATGLFITADARLDNREELIASLGVEEALGRTLPDAALLTLAYEKWEADCPEKLLGDFAFCIWDTRRQRLFCARDHMGVKPLYYHYSPRQFTAASEIGALFRAGRVPKVLNEDRVADYLIPSLEDKVGTFFRDIVRLPPAHSVTVTRDGMRLRRYWALDPRREIRYRTDDEYSDHLREIFFEAVKCRLRSAFPVGALLSGGIDSSSIVCAARTLIPEAATPPLHTFSAVFPATPECDESGYIASVTLGGGLQPHYVDGASSSPLSDFRESLAHDDEPYFGPNIFLHRTLYRAARTHEVRVLLDGIDGDHAISHGLARITELAHAGRLFAAAAEVRLAAKRLNLPPWTLVRRRVIAPLLPGPIRAAWRTVKPRAPTGALVFSPAVSERREHWRSLERPVITAREDHARGLASGIVPLTLEAADRASSRLGIEPRYPFFDKRLLEYCVALPADQKLREGWTRWVMRRAMQGVLPPQVQWRPGKADLSPNFVETLLNDILPDPAAYSTLTPYTEMRSLQSMLERAAEHRRQDDLLALWRVSSLALWLRSSGLQS